MASWFYTTKPQVTLRAGALGICAMLRWSHPQLGLIGPERFLPLAEDSGLLEPLTEWLLEATRAQIRRWSTLGLDRMHVALPLLSRQQLAWNGLAGRVQEHLRDAK
jgi:EAL domain-containing protein (putative c-di-GMP-specific phosphodiesterase class I)